MEHFPIVLFALELAKHWVAFVMGSAVMAVIAIVERAIRKLPTSFYVVVVLLVGTVCATYGAWQDQHAARIQEHDARRSADQQVTRLQGQLDALNQPKFDVVIRRIGPCGCQLKPKTYLVMTLLVDISNTGAPSFIQDAELEATLTDGRTFQHVRPTYLMKKIAGKETPADNLLSRYDEDPIPSHTRVRGWLFFTLHDVASNEVYIKGDRFTLQVWDSTGKEYTNTWTMTGGREVNPPYFPGQS